MLLAQTIRQARLDHGLTQAQLAERLGVTQTTVWRWEEAGSEPRIDKLSRLAEALELDYNELLDLTVQASSNRAVRRSRQQTALRVIRNEPLPEPMTGSMTGPTTRQYPDRWGAAGGRGTGVEDRLALLEQQVVLVLQRVGVLAEALERAGVSVPAEDGNGQDGSRDGDGNRAGVSPPRHGPPSVQGSPASRSASRRKRS